jgi:hypothetical protein
MARWGPAMKSAPFVPIVATLAVTVMLQACGTLPCVEAVPPDQTERAVISLLVQFTLIVPFLKIGD